MPYKLVYFPLRGRGQAIRYLLIDNAIEYEEELVPADPAVWVIRKPKTILGQLPILFDGSLELGQSNAILRHLARKHGLYGKDDTDRAVIDMINDQQEDTRLAYVKLIYGDYENEKEEFVKSLPDKLAVFEKLLGRNNGGKGYFVGSQVNYVDYNLFDLLDDLLLLSPTALDSTPLLRSFHARMAAKDKLSRYRQTDAFKKMKVNYNGKQ